MTTLSAAVSTRRLLVVEDDDSIRETVGEALRAEGFEVLTSSNGAAALDLVMGGASDPVDLIVLDLMLPGLGGLDFCRELRRFNIGGALQGLAAAIPSNGCVVVPIRIPQLRQPLPVPQ